MEPKDWLFINGVNQMHINLTIQNNTTSELVEEFTGSNKKRIKITTTLPFCLQ